MNEQFPPSPRGQKPTTDEQRSAAAQAGQPQPGQFPPITDRTLSGQQLQALAKNHADHLAAIKRDVELRKWAVDQAIAFSDTSAASGTNLMKVSREIHAFLVEGAEKAETGL